MTTNITHQSMLGKLSARTVNILQALTKSSMAEKAIEQVEAERLAERQQMLIELAAIDAGRPEEATKHGQAANAARIEMERAEQAYRKAKEFYNQTSMLSHGATMAHEYARGDIIRKLQETADPRINDFRAEVSQLLNNDMVFALHYWGDEEKRRKGLIPLSSNLDVWTEAKHALEAMLPRLEAMTQQVLSYVDVSQALMGMCQELAKPLAQLQLNPPSLTAEHAEVGSPLMWAGQSRWIVDELASDAELKERAEARRAKRSRLDRGDKVGAGK